MRRFVSLMMALFLMISLLAACGSDGADASNGSSAAVNADGFSTETVKFVDDNGESVYNIIRAQNFSGEAVAKAKELFTALKSAVSVKNLKNQSDDAVKANSDEYEILLGHTNRPESQTALDHLRTKSSGRSRDFIIATVGKKIVINAFSESGIMDAIDYFVANYCKATIEGGIYYVCTTEGQYPNVTINGTALGSFCIVRPKYNVSYIVQLQIDELQKLVDSTYAYALECHKDDEAEAEYEIIVGEAQRSGVQYLGGDEYGIVVLGKKVYLNGGSIQATAMAVSEFGKLLSKGGLTDADTVFGRCSEAIANYDKSKYYTYSWGDDFDGNAIDTTKWYVAPEGRFDVPGMNGRTSIRTDSKNNVFLNDGKFYIKASYTKDKYIGGLIMTQRNMIYRYGYLEMSAVLPHGDGFWSALWVDSRGHTFWPPPEEEAGKLYGAEIDVNECFGNANVIAANVHKWPTDEGAAIGHGHTSLDATYGNQKKYSLTDGETFNNGFHTFGFIWTDTHHSFTCDGEIYFSYENNTTDLDRDGLHVLSFVRLSAAIGYESLGTIAADDDPVWNTSNELIVDYVHIYQLDDGKSELLTQ